MLWETCHFFHPPGSSAVLCIVTCTFLDCQLANALIWSLRACLPWHTHPATPAPALCSLGHFPKSAMHFYPPSLKDVVQMLLFSEDFMDLRILRRSALPSALGGSSWYITMPSLLTSGFWFSKELFYRVLGIPFVCVIHADLNCLLKSKQYFPCLHFGSLFRFLGVNLGSLAHDSWHHFF